MPSSIVPAYFSRQAFPVLESAFQQRANSPPFDVARLFADLSVRALAACGRLHDNASLGANDPISSSLLDDERIAQFARMLDRAEALAAAESARQIELRHLLQASFEERSVLPAASANASNLMTADLVAAMCLDLRMHALEQSDFIHRIQVRYHVLCTGKDVVDYGNDYETFADAVRAMRHLQQRARLRALGEVSNHVTHVMIFIPGNAEAVSNVAIQARAADS